MPLRFEPDVREAHWLLQSDAPWTQVCSIGPDGFAGHARVQQALPDQVLSGPRVELPYRRYLLFRGSRGAR